MYTVMINNRLPVEFDTLKKAKSFAKTLHNKKYVRLVCIYCSSFDESLVEYYNETALDEPEEEL